MAKKELINTNLFARTGDPEMIPQPPADDPARKRRRKDASDPVISKGIGLRQSEWAKFEGMANELGTNYHDLALYVIADFMARWDRGERPPTETKQVLKRQTARLYMVVYELGAPGDIELLKPAYTAKRE